MALAGALAMCLLAACGGQGTGGGTQSGSNGDLSAWGRDVTVNHDLSGRLRVSNGNVVVNGSVQGEVEVWNGSLHVNGHIGQDVRLSQGTFTLARNGAVAGAVYVYNHGQNVQVDGNVGGNLQVSDAPVVLGSGSSVGGVKVWSGSLNRQPGSQIHGPISVYH